MPSDPTRVVAIDLGGTLLRAACVTEAGLMIHRREIATPTGGPEAVIEAIVGLTSEVLEQVAANREAGAPMAVGLAAPGPLDPATGVVYRAANIPGFEDVPLGELLGAHLGLPVWVHNDANLAALGEFRFGAGRGHDPLVYLTVSTGIGGGIIRVGQIDSGRFGLAGELGHTIVAAGEEATCGFGHRGCLESLASGTSLARDARARLEDGAQSSIADHAGADRISAAAVGRAADAGDDLACELFATAGRWLGLAVGGFINVFDPSRVVVGGGLTQSWHLMVEAIETAADSVVIAKEHRRTAIVRAECGDDSGLLGAAAYALDRLHV